MRLLKNYSYRLVESRELLNRGVFSDGDFSIREYVIGDGGYALLPWLMIPFQMSLNEMKIIFNYRLSSSRIVVERAFGRRKEIWHYLYGIIANPNMHNLARAIVVCCTLHNMCIDCGGLDDDNI